MPCPDKPKTTPGDVLVLVQQVVASQLYTFATSTVQDSIDLVAETLQLMKVGVSPDGELGKGAPFLNTVHASLQHFVRATVIDAAAEEKFLSGLAAFTCLLTDVQHRLDSPAGTVEVPTVKHMEVFNEFQYPLDAAQKKALPKLIQKAILAHAATGVEDPFLVPGAASSSADGSKKRSARGDAKTSPDKSELKAHIMEFFKPRGKKA